MSRLKHSVDSPHTKPWIERIGKIVLNFSVLELESILWSVQLSEQEKNIKAFVETPFTPRVTRLMTYVEDRSINPRWRKASLRAWNDSLKLAMVRNHIAHNPIILGWRNPTETGEPDFVGIPNLRVPRSAKKNWTLSKSEADKCTNDIVAVATRLAELRIEWCKIRDQGLAPPVRIESARWNKLRRRIARTLSVLGVRNDRLGR